MAMVYCVKKEKLREVLMEMPLCCKTTMASTKRLIAKEIFKDLEKLSDVFTNYDIVMHSDKYKKIKEKYV